MLRAGFAAACATRGRIDRDIAVGDRAIRLRFAGPALLEPMAALADSGEPPADAVAATVLLWDAASTGVPLPPVVWRETDLDDRGQSRGYHVRDWDRDQVLSSHDQGYGAIMLFDLATRTAVYATLDAEAVPIYERAAPLRTILHWALSEPGRHLVHAGAVGGPQGGVLVAGKSGSGKSTLTLCCADAGLGYLGDDYVLIDVGVAPAVAHAVHTTAKVVPGGAGWHLAPPRAEVPRDETDNGKVVLDVRSDRPGALVASAPVRAVVLPRVGEGPETVVRRASAAEGLRAIAPSTVLQHFGHGGSGIATVAELLRRVPVYRFELGPDMGPALAAVQRLARGLAP